MATLDPVPDAVFSLFDDVAVAHTVPCHVPLPVNGVEVIILANPGELLLLRVKDVGRHCLVEIVGQGMGKVGEREQRCE